MIKKTLITGHAKRYKQEPKVSWYELLLRIYYNINCTYMDR